MKAAIHARDYAETINRLRQAAEEGGADEQVRLGAIYQYGRNGVAKDRAEAMKWFRKAADQGDAHGQIELGDMFYFGSMATQNYVEAAKWYRKSAKWYRKAAERGSMHGQEKLGSLYRHGEGVDKDLREAQKWFRMAAGQGNLHARRALYEMSNKGRIEIAFKELSQTVKILLFLLLWFPVWWLIGGYFFNCPSKCLNIIVIVIFLGGVVGFLVTFACNGGAGGSSEMRASAWGCLLPYMAVHNIALALLFFSGLRKREG